MSTEIMSPPVAERVQKAARVTPHISTDEWWTPLPIIKALGSFDLDPCAPVADPLRTGAARSLTRLDDGFTAEWAGRVWLNPPYSTAGAWVEKLADHGNGIALVFARVETGWWHQHVWPKAAALLFLRGRIAFVRGDGIDRPGHNAAAPSVLIAYGAENAEALRLSGLAGAYVDLAAVKVAA